MIAVICENCGRALEKYPSTLKRNKHSFCSQDCCNAWRTGRPRPEHGPKVRQALKGRKPSLQCLEAASRTKRRELSNPEVQAKMQAGLRKYYETHPGPNKGRFGAKNYNWKGGISFEPYATEFNDILKEHIRQRDNYTCQLCRISQDEHLELYNCRLAIHHIDYDKQNSDPLNLIALCSGCNSTANGNREYHQQIFTSYTAHIDTPLSVPVQSALIELAQESSLRPRDCPPICAPRCSRSHNPDIHQLRLPLDTD